MAQPERVMRVFSAYGRVVGPEGGQLGRDHGAPVPFEASVVFGGGGMAEPPVKTRIGTETFIGGSDDRGIVSGQTGV
ncbi:hypothetical protein GCM10010317_010880 [Streptomyces mirabilis]|nr:hypothetical protein GCM10010317_010880 [Streptomyces mirabilis]